ncbi:MAG: hypothetical protein C0473_04130 [Cyanobacteria bacterium DS3.002]|nr:hypothetical protein [Cyanobacteria bacterium DS3.002]MBA4050140.1 hypothetical protein [Cyanobacteria bacterium DS2.008]
MKWTGKAEIETQVQKLWESGAILAEIAGAPSAFPYKLRLKTPASNEMPSSFDQVRSWATEFRKIPHVRIVEREFNHKVLGRNSLPAEVWLDSLEAAADFAGKNCECEKFREIIAISEEAHPLLIPWLQKYPLRALSYHKAWPLLLTIISWLKANPQPDIYLRQIDMPGIHTKFVERHFSILSELLDANLDHAPSVTESRNIGITGLRGFEQRYRFKSKPILVRFRTYRNHGHQLVDACDSSDIDNAIALESLKKTVMPAHTVFITENEINYLAFPLQPSTMVIFGSGIGVLGLLQSLEWLKEKNVIYWGDLDTQGFSILNKARKILPEIKSMLMDQRTLDAHLQMLVEEPVAVQFIETQFTRLTQEELNVCMRLKGLDNLTNARLEQERITWGFACEQIAKFNHH